MNKIFWNAYWKKSDLQLNDTYIPPGFEIWGKYLPNSEKSICLEIGCVPGRALIYLNKKYKYQILGVDYSKHLPLTEENLRTAGVLNFKLFNEDFLAFSSEIKADIVLSIGFIEHFLNFEEVLDKHIKHLNPSGTIIIVIPNFRFFQYLLHSLFDREILKNHVLKIMNPRILYDFFKRNNMEICVCRYWKTFDWWIESKGKNKLIKILREKLLGLTWLINNNLKKIGLSDIPNRYFSPYIVCVAKKRE